MGYKVVEFRQTPNPDALKCMVDPPVPPLAEAPSAPADAPRRPRAYRSAADATSDPLALALFAVQGVTNVLIHEQWITVNKDKAVSWPTLKPKVEKALRDAP